MFYGHAAHFWFTLRKYSSQEKNEWGEKEKKNLFLLLCERREPGGSYELGWRNTSSTQTTLLSLLLGSLSLGGVSEF